MEASGFLKWREIAVGRELFQEPEIRRRLLIKIE